MHVKVPYRLDVTPALPPVHTAVVAEPSLLLHLPSNVIEDVLSGQ
jgi:hypothetical protein